MNEKITIRNYAPLVFLVLIELVWAWYLTSTVGDGTLFDGVRYFMGIFLLIAGILKVFKLKGFVDTFKHYDIAAQSVPSYSYLYPFIEIWLGINFLFQYALITSNIIVIVLMVIGIIGIWQSIRYGRKIMCACMGYLFKLPLSKVSLIEDIIMLIMAVLMLNFLV